MASYIQPSEINRASTQRGLYHRKVIDSPIYLSSVNPINHKHDQPVKLSQMVQ